MNSKKAFAFLRITFGALWAVDAYFKWSAVFMNGLTGYLTSALTGQPPFVQDWITMWIGIISPHQHFFAILVALIETIIAICLLAGFCTRITLVLGSVFSLLLWSLPEGFGGPYMAGVTDVGASIIYIFVFAALWIGGSWQEYSIDGFLKRKCPNCFLWKGANAAAESETPGNRRVVVSLLLLVIVLMAVVATQYSPTLKVGVGSMAPMGMAVKTYPVDPSGPVPTVSFVITQDPAAMGGWDVRASTTNFTFTPQNVNQAPVPNQGHIHIYVDGTLYVSYSPWYHLGDLAPGQHIVTVALAANDHSIFTLNGNYIQTQKTIVQN